MPVLRLGWRSMRFRVAANDLAMTSIDDPETSALPGPHDGDRFGRYRDEVTAW
jgi:hypothetical protein